MSIYLKLITFIMSAILFTSTSFGISNVMLTVSNISNLFEKHFLDIKFTGGDNNFNGVLFLLPTEDLENAYKIYDGTETKKCYKKINGLYYNSSLGDRILPLDQENLNYLENINSNYKNMSLSGGFYTACEDDTFSVYGQINYELNGINFSTLTAGLNYDYTNNKIIYNSKFAKTLQYKDGKKLVGYIYDSSGGIGSIGFTSTLHNKILSKINDENKSIKDIIFDETDTIDDIDESEQEGAVETLVRVYIGGNMNISDNVIIDTLKDYINIDASSNKVGTNSMQTESIKISDVLNKHRKKYGKICRNKWLEPSSSNLENNLSNVDDVLCIKGDGTNQTVELTIGTTVGSIKDTIISDGVNIKLKGRSLRDKEYLKVFVDKANLILSNDIDMFDIDGNGKVVSSGNGVTRGVKLNGQFIINGLLLGGDSDNKFNHKLYMDGSLLSMNTISTPTDKRKNYVKSLVGNGYSQSIDYLDVFDWRCEELQDGTVEGSDGESCDSSNDKYRIYPLIINYKKY